ncbi:MAG: AAA family ATPase [Polyangiaceae bacterium]
MSDHDTKDARHGSPGSFRVYLVPHGSGPNRLIHGQLIRTWNAIFDTPVPSAIGHTDTEVLAELEQIMLQRVATQEDSVERYLWSEPFAVREVKVELFPLTTVENRPVIGAKSVELTVAYAHCALEGGGHRIMVPRFGGSFVVEEHKLAPAILRHAISTWMLGEEPRSLYDFRFEGEERVLAWSPPLLARLPASGATERVDTTFQTLRRIADDWVASSRTSGSSDPLPSQVPPIYGDSAELAALLPRLSAPVLPSLLVVGPPSVGKTTLVRRIARHFAHEKLERGVRRRKLFATSADRILAGMVYLGMWQERCLHILRELEGQGDYLYLGSLSSILRAQPDGSSIAEMLEPAILAGELSIIVEATPFELERAERVAPGLVAKLVRVHVAEPTTSATMELARTHAARRGLPELTPRALKTLVHLSATFTRATAFPGKALRFVDWLATGSGGALGGAPLLPREIEVAFSKYSGIPVEVLSDEHAMTVDDVTARLGEKVVGQPEACRAAARVLVRFKANLADPDKPAGTLLFLGPTGVGKTELAKQIGRLLFGEARRLVRLDMSEYRGWDAADRLIDASPGVVSLARAVATDPLSVVLLDEIEKASAAVFDLLLGVLGEGRLTDSAGRLVDFRSAIVVMTSNLGSRDARPAGFGASADRDYLRAVREHFRPEFVARLDAVVPFSSLQRADVERITRMTLASLSTREGSRAAGSSST